MQMINSIHVLCVVTFSLNKHTIDIDISDNQLCYYYITDMHASLFIIIIFIPFIKDI